jgi:flagellar secretion chaperone FliS
MTQTPAQNYLKMKVLTATPEQLQMMLFDGALRFGQQARAALLGKKFDESFEHITRVQNIVLELRLSLKRDVYPELCDKLAAIYLYIHRKLVDANINHGVDSLDEAIKLLGYQRETWSLLLQKLGKEKAAKAATTIDMPAPSERMEASISMQG